MKINRRSLCDLTMGIIGAGSLGFALANGLKSSGYRVTGVWTRTFSRTQTLIANLPDAIPCKNMQEVADNCQLIFITVPDDNITEVADSINWKNGQFVIHCSGIHPKCILQNAEQQGAITGGFHPLQTFSRFKIEPQLFKGITFGIDAPNPLFEILESIGNSLGGKSIFVTGKDRILYHASATTTCALLVVLINLAANLWDKFQTPFMPDTHSGLNALIPLIRETLNNLEESGPVNALTGPFVRGDIGTIKGHIEALGEQDSELLEIYGLLGMASLPLAKQKGNLNLQRIEEIRRLLLSGISVQKDYTTSPESFRTT